MAKTGVDRGKIPTKSGSAKKKSSKSAGSMHQSKGAPKMGVRC